jgi:hypothetical protein
VPWYNDDHRHSGLRYIAPAQRHAGEDHAILASRHVLYEHARLGAVTLNPKRDAFVPPRSTTSQCDIRAAA